ncbi:MarR family winged helix-turn-helix transcriptional regulator [Leifsonia flava]|nr:MarR family transcriptional regulator [Leifsonia flava]
MDETGVEETGVEAGSLRRITRAHQRLHSATEQVSSAFASLQGLHQIDLEALLAVMNAERAGSPLTPGQLGAAVRLSSAATTGLVDRLERAGHLVRRRDDEDRRRVHLYYADASMKVAEQFFGPLGKISSDLLARYTPQERELITGYLEAAADGMAAHARALQEPGDN